LRKKWAATYRDYRRLLDAPPAATPPARDDQTRQLDTLREQIRRTKEELVVVQEIQGRYRPDYQAHGFVWLFLRKPATATGQSPTKGP